MAEADPPPLTELTEGTQMEIHKPKPVHNWREFLTEVGTIVLGVLIALGAEQAVDWMHWRSEVAQAQEFIATEMAINMRNGIERVRREHCLEQTIDAVAQILDTASHTGTLPAVGQLAGPPSRVWNSTVWNSVIASQASSHFSRQQLADLGRSYEQIQRLNENNTEEMVAWSNLDAIVGSGRRFDPSSEAALRSALSQVRWYNRILALGSGQMVARVQQLNLPFSQNDLGIIASAAHSPLTCLPIGPSAPSVSGQAPLSTVPAQIDDFLKQPPYR